jgi:hypothetical protein
MVGGEDVNLVFNQLVIVSLFCCSDFVVQTRVQSVSQDCIRGSDRESRFA